MLRFFDDDVECLDEDADDLAGIVAQVCDSIGDQSTDQVEENADTSLVSVSSDVPKDPSSLDARRAFKTLQRFAAKNLFGSGPTEALMKLEVCMTDAKLDGFRRQEDALPR